MPFRQLGAAAILLSVSREVLTSVLGNQTADSTVVLLGSSAGGIGAFNVVNWVLDSFDQVRLGTKWLQRTQKHQHEREQS